MLDHFIQYLTTEKRFSEHTCLAYRKDLDQFIEFSSVENYSDVKEIESSLIRGWMVSLIENNYSSNSVNRKISSLKSFFKWLLKNEKIDSNPARLVTAPKKSKRLPSFVQEKDIELSNMLELFTDDFEGVRDQLMIEVFYQTGIRSSELINLIESSIGSTQIKVVGKRNKERIIPITNNLVKLIEKYRGYKEQKGFTSSSFFLLKTGKKLYPKFVYRKINIYLSKVTELEKKSPHVLRHTFATHMLNSGAGLEVLKELLGHANLSATQVYTHNSFSQLVSIYSQSHPRGTKK